MDVLWNRAPLDPAKYLPIDKFGLTLSSTVYRVVESEQENSLRPGSFIRPSDEKIAGF